MTAIELVLFLLSASTPLVHCEHPKLASKRPSHMSVYFTIIYECPYRYPSAERRCGHSTDNAPNAELKALSQYPRLCHKSRASSASAFRRWKEVVWNSGIDEARDQSFTLIRPGVRRAPCSRCPCVFIKKCIQIQMRVALDVRHKNSPPQSSAHMKHLVPDEMSDSTQRCPDTVLFMIGRSLLARTEILPL
jgi:hypothetical protein